MLALAPPLSTHNGTGTRQLGGSKASGSMPARPQGGERTPGFRSKD